MSVLIKNMKIPTGCGNCKFCWVDMNDRFCLLTGKFDINKYYPGKHPSCPITEEIPDEHGDLKDVDDILNRFVLKPMNDSVSMLLSIQSAIEESPTIIEGNK